MKKDLLLELIKMAIGNESSEPATVGLKNMHVGKYVIVRTDSAGVHFGKLIEREGNELVLDESRRIWSWEGAFTLSAIAESGVSSAKLSTTLDGVLLIGAIEVLPLSEVAKGG